MSSHVVPVDETSSEEREDDVPPGEALVDNLLVMESKVESCVLFDVLRDESEEAEDLSGDFEENVESNEV